MALFPADDEAAEIAKAMVAELGAPDGRRRRLRKAMKLRGRRRAVTGEPKVRHQVVFLRLTPEIPSVGILRVGLSCGGPPWRRACASFCRRLET